jgi:hypothetical protein
MALQQTREEYDMYFFRLILSFNDSVTSEIDRLARKYAGRTKPRSPIASQRGRPTWANSKTHETKSPISKRKSSADVNERMKKSRRRRIDSSSDGEFESDEDP